VILTVSDQTDPYLNLAVEEYLAERLAEERVLFLWVNSPVVVIGVNQDPWLESDPARLARERVALARRMSGGGAVFQDAGNLNFSFMCARRDLRPEENSALVCGVLRSLGLEAVADRRHRIMVRGRKVSGSAFRLSRRYAVHHGTLLVDVSIERMHRLLCPRVKPLASCAVRSAPYPTANIREWLPSVTVDAVRERLTGAARAQGGEFVPLEELVDRQRVRELSRRLRTWKWVFGRTPPGRVLVEKGSGEKAVVADIRWGMVTELRPWPPLGPGRVLWRGEAVFDPERIWSVVEGMGPAAETERA